MRIYQYTKNVLIFAPIFFFPDINDLGSIVKVTIAFVLFSLISSSVYILNDYIDREEDAKHPNKKNRPLTSGLVDTRQAFILLVCLLSTGIFGAIALLGKNVMLILLGYFLLNLTYSLYIKHIPILDICTIGIGFVIRLFVGAEVLEAVLSPWIVILTLLLALFLAIAKRRDDVLIMEETGLSMRKSIVGYNLPFTNAIIIMLSTMVLVSYIMYTVSDEIIQKWDSQYIYTTSLFVFLGIMRYLQLIFVENTSGNPTAIILEDRFIQIVIFLWVTLFGWFIYG